MDTWQILLVLVAVPAALVVGLLLGRRSGMALGSAEATASGAAELAAVRAERDLWEQRVGHLERTEETDRQVLDALAPLRQTMRRLTEQVHELERDRTHQFGQVGEQLLQVAGHTEALRASTASLAGALNSSGTRGTWGEVQLRRLLEHAGMLAHCDFDEQVSAISTHDARIRPDLLVRLPGQACVVLDSKAPLTAFLRAQEDGLAADERQRLLREHARALRGHVDTLAGKAYWTAFSTAPEFVICFVPSDAVLAAALQADPSLYEHAQARKVVLASPATLLALLRAVAFGWQQQALTDNARELLDLGVELHQRLSTLGGRVSDMGRALTRAVEGYNAMVGTLEARVLVTSRKLHDLGLAPERLDELLVIDQATRPLTAPELIDNSRH